MNKTARIVLLILAAFALSSLAVYRLQLSVARRAPQRNQPGRTIRAAMKTVEGQIDTVDPDAGTLTLNDGTEKVTLAFDERTEIVESGKIVEPGLITSGASATVKYTQRRGRNLARKIELIASAPADSNQ
ncbi:MAG TPA: hypothetical protein VNS63_14750 [Blastocatellia bacterium]|nr:hypothetical protein [Blastocatellia bacterium]